MDGKIIQEVEKSMSGLKVLQAKSITRGLTFGFDVTPLFCTISVDNISALIGAMIYLPLLSADKLYLIDQSVTSARVQIVRYSVGTVRIEYNNVSDPLLVTFLG
jgi:hypothetical protein